jgi:septum formation protein
VLASGSPRRRELLAALVAEFEVVPSDVPEEAAGDPVQDALHLAEAKARAVAETASDAVVIGCDTIVHDGRRSYGKPVDAADALRMWRELRGRSHRVVTGVAVVFEGKVLTGHSEAAVTLADLGDETIAQYVASGRPLDKAGAYAIQDDDVPTVARLDGCYCCVVGLPLWRLRGLLERAGVACRKPGETYGRCRACPERNDDGAA